MVDYDDVGAQVRAALVGLGMTEGLAVLSTTYWMIADECLSREGSREAALLALLSAHAGIGADIMGGRLPTSVQ